MIEILNELAANVEYTFDDWLEDNFPNEIHLDSPDNILMRIVWLKAKETDRELLDIYPPFLFTKKKYALIEKAWDGASNKHDNKGDNNDI